MRLHRRMHTGDNVSHGIANQWSITAAPGCAREAWEPGEVRGVARMRASGSGASIKAFALSWYKVIWMTNTISLWLLRKCVHKTFGQQRKIISWINVYTKYWLLSMLITITYTIYNTIHTTFIMFAKGASPWQRHTKANTDIHILILL